MPKRSPSAPPPVCVEPDAPEPTQWLAMHAFGEADETVKLLRVQHHLLPCLPHAHHDFVELVYIEAGRGAHYVADTSYELSMGDICVINIGTPHHFVAAPGCELTIVNCLLAPSFLERVFPERENRHSLAYGFFSSFVIGRIHDPQEDMRLKGKDTHQIRQLLETMLLEYAERRPGYVQLLEGYMKVLVYLVIRIYTREAGVGHEDRSQTVQRVMAYLRQGSCADTRVSDVARLFFLSPKYLCRLFKHYTGQTIVDYIQDARIEAAIKLLASSSCSIRDISTDVGYNDVTFFYGLFKKRTGLTPGRYREKLSGRADARDASAAS